MSVTLPYIPEKYEQQPFVTALNDIVEALESLGSDIETVSSTPTEAPIPESTQATIDELLQSSESLYGKIGELTSMLLDEARSRGADIVDMQTKIQDANHSIARQIKMITASLNTNAAGVLELRGAMVTLKNAMAESTTLLAAEFNGNLATFSDRITTIADAETALAIRTTTLEANVATNTAAITTEQTVRASADSALSSNITTLGTTVSGHTTTLSTYGSSIDGLKGKYGVKIDANGYVSGFVMNNDSTTSDFIINADKFQIIKPGASAATFTVEGGQVKINGALIVNSSVNTGQMASNSISSMSISQLASGEYTLDQTVYVSPSITASGIISISFTAPLDAGPSINIAVQIFVNGTQVYSESVHSGQIYSITIGSAFVSGSNAIRFYMYNTAGGPFGGGRIPRNIYTTVTALMK